MPTLRRMASMALTSSLSSTPSTMSLPCWCSSSRLMQRISVLLPEPDGPQMTMRSPRATARSMSRSTWNSPYHLLTPANSMMGSCCIRAHCACGGAGVQMLFDPPAVARHREADDEVDRRHEQLAFEEELAPVGVAQRELQRAGQVVQADDGDQRGVLEGADEGVDDRRHHQAQRLRQDDLALRLPVAQAERLRGLDLALGQRLQTAAHHLGQVGRGEQRHADQHAQQHVDGAALRHEQWQHERGHEQHRDQRHATDQLDVEHAQRADAGQARLAPERHQHRQREGDRPGSRVDSIRVSGRPPQRAVSTGARPNHAAEHQHEEDGQHRRATRAISHGRQNGR